MAPELTGVLETVLYVTDLERAERFYGEALGLRLIAREPGRSLFYRAGPGVLLLFRAEATRQAGTLPAHGADGPGHSCFRVPAPAYEPWKRHLADRGVTILQEVDWPRGLSFYFRDPDGNLLEIANADIWAQDA
ncbi:MAG TPA: VOC family protein [Candidatus Polarisedimenticolaceae bacterium]|nr:VOC family protein [Candidatus Polarisedimenticolaceae bacterium]